MFQEVSGAVRLISLSAAAGIYPDPDGRCLRPGRVLGRNLFIRKQLLTSISGKGRRYGEAVAESRALGRRGERNGGCKSSLRRLDGP